MEKNVTQTNPGGCATVATRVALTYSACHVRGGVERVLVRCANFLSAGGHRVSVMARDFCDPGCLLPEVERVPLHSPALPFGMNLPWDRAASRRRMREWGAHRVGGFGVQSPEGSVVWVQSVHAAWWELSRGRRRGVTRLRQAWNPFHRVVLSMERALYGRRRYRRLVALTEGVRADLGRFYGVPESDVSVLPNGFDSSEFHAGLREESRQVLRSRLRIPLDARVILFLANEWERKGLMPLFEAFRQLQQPDVHLVVVGRLPDAFLKEQAARIGIRCNLHFRPATSAVAPWFAMADVFALPTSYEAWGMVIVEALACGTPVLTSRLAGASVAVREGLSGVLLDTPSDPMEIASGLRKLLSGVVFDPLQIAASVAPYQWSELLPCYERILLD
jgi:UDP-glucose:(heptosyl)LPS alpha-1,3-glucosyltransferase